MDAIRDLWAVKNPLQPNGLNIKEEIKAERERERRREERTQQQKQQEDEKKNQQVEQTRLKRTETVIKTTD